jgi:hypothetical protein
VAKAKAVINVLGEMKTKRQPIVPPPATPASP